MTLSRELLLSLSLFFIGFFIVEHAESTDVSGKAIRDSITDDYLAENKDVDSISNDPVFVKDLNSIEKMSVSVNLVDGISYAGNATGVYNGTGKYERWGTEYGYTYPLKLSEKQVTIARDLLRDLMLQYPLHRSFQSIQDKNLVEPLHHIWFHVSQDGKSDDLPFRVNIYMAYKPNGWIEVQHKLGGSRIPLKGNAAIKIYSFFADLLKEKMPDSVITIHRIVEDIKDSEPENPVPLEEIDDLSNRTS